MDSDICKLKEHIETWVEMNLSTDSFIKYPWTNIYYSKPQYNRDYKFALGICEDISYIKLNFEYRPREAYSTAEFVLLNTMYISRAGTSVQKLTEEIFDHICTILTRERMLGHL
jgi:hypothetical protein